MLNVIADADLRFIETAIIAAVRNARGLDGKAILLPTINSQQLRQAAKLSVSMAISDDVWDGAEVLKVPPPQRVRGFVDITE